MNSRPLILAIDDQEDQLRALEEALAPCDFGMITATSGAQGIEILRDREFAAILLDVQMPDMDGFETALWVRARDIRTPIVFLTEKYADESFAMRGYEAGAVDFLFKPLNPDILCAKLSVLVGLYRKQRELEIKSALIAERAERRYRDLVEGIPNGIVWTSVVGSGYFNYVSASAEKISGFPLEAWLGTRHFMLAHSHPEDVEVVGTSISEILITGRDIDTEHRLIKADGKTLWLRTTVRIAELANYREYRGISVDITSLKETEQSLRETIDIRDEFLSIASHELKTPITPLQLQIQGFRRLSQKGELHRLPPETLNRMLDVSATQIDSLSRLVHQLLDVSRIKSGRVHIDLSAVDLSHLIRHVVEVFRSNFALESVDLKLDLPDSLRGKWDATRMEQVLVNLLDNAIKYGMGKPIELSLREVEGRAEIQVLDHGIGISVEDQERIFRRFERAVSPNNYRGMGLGLYITQQIIDLHGGTISVESTPGQGSVFKLSLPLDP